MKRKALSLLLCFMLLVTLTPTSFAWADAIPEQQANEQSHSEQTSDEAASVNESVTEKVTVVFDVPDGSTVAIYSSTDKDSENKPKKIMELKESFSFEAEPGSYLYSVFCDGYKDVTYESFRVEAAEGKTEQTVKVDMNAAEPSEETAPADEVTSDQAGELAEAEETEKANEPARSTGESNEAQAELSDVYVLYDEGSADSAVITYNANGGSGEMPTQTVNKSSTSEPLYANTFTREGYSFVGWSLTPALDKGVSAYRSGMTAHITGDTTLYAIWDEAPEGYTHIFNSAQYGNTLVTLGDDGNGGWKITGFNVWAAGQYGSNDPGSPQKIYIPATYAGKPITGIGGSAFKTAGLTKVQFAPDSQIKTIEGSAFYGNNLGGALKLPVTVESIGSSAFSNNAISSVNFTELTELETIGSSGFSMNRLSSLDLRNTKVTKLANSVFAYTNQIVNPVLHPETTTIGQNALNNCRGTVKIPSTVTSIGSNAFQLISGNTLIDVSEVADDVIVRDYGNMLGRYYDAIKHTKIKFPDSWYDNDTDFIIHDGTIYGMKDSWAGGTITVPARDDITAIARSAFATRPAYNNYTSLIFEDGCKVTSLPTELCTIQHNLKTVQFHEGLTRIGTRAFYECHGLTSLTNLPESLVTISNGAFTECKNIKEVVIPKNVSGIGNEAFSYNYALEKVTIGDETGSALTGKPASAIGASTFYFDNTLKDIYVPGVTEAFGTANAPWSSYPWAAANATMHWKDDDTDPRYTEVVGDDGSHWLFRNGQLVTLLGTEREDGTLNAGYSSAERIDVTVPTTVYAVTDTDHSEPLIVNSLGTRLLPDRADGKKRYIGTLTVPGSFKNINEGVFRQSSDSTTNFTITTVVLEEGVETVGNSAFYNASMTNLYLPSTLRSIGNTAFEWAGLYHIYGRDGEGILPEGMKSIGSAAFGWTNFPEITIPSSMTTIASDAFYKTYALKKIQINQYRNAEGKPEDGVLAPSSWVGNNFGSATVGTNVFFLDSITTEVEQVGDAVNNLDEQTTTVIVRARKNSGVNTLVDPYLTARSDEDIADFHIIKEGSDEWEDDYDSDWVYVSLTVYKDKTYYFDGSFHNNTTGQNTTAPLPITVKNNFGTLVYDRNGGVGSIPDSVTKLSGTAVTVAPIPTDLKRYGYMVGDEAEDPNYGWIADDKWNTAPDKSGTDYKPGDTIELPTGTITLYPSWVPDPAVLYEVIYRVADHGSFAEGAATSNQDIQVLSNAEVTGSSAAADTGYHVTGWFKDGERVTTSATLSAQVARNNLNRYGSEAYANTLYIAGIEANTYKIVFNANGGEGTMANQQMTYDTEAALTANAYTKTGYTFTGWNTKTDGSGTAYNDGQTVNNLTTKNNGTVTLYAQWEPISYTISYDANGGSGTMQDQAMTYDVSDNLTKNAFTREHYQFAGWNTAADGSGTDYTDGKEVINLTSQNNGTVTLYAQWNAEIEVVVTGSRTETPYNGNPQSSNGYTVTYKIGGVNDDQLPAGITAAVSASQNGAAVDPIAASGTDAGTYTATVTASLSGTADGYVICNASATADIVLVIKPLAVTVTADNKGKVYGETDPELTATVNGTIGNDTVTYNISRRPGENAGTYAITPSGDAAQGNYTVTYEPGVFTISKKAAKITANNSGKTYGDTDPQLTATVSGTVGNDTLNYTLGRDLGENVGDYPIKVTLGDNPNYDVSTKNAVFTISAAGTLEVRVTGYNDEYDGDSHSPTAWVSVTEGTKIEYEVNGAWTETAPSIKDAGTATYKVRATNPNYTTAETTVTLTVTPKPVKVTAQDKTFTYNGTAQSWDKYDVTGLVGEDAIKATVTGSITFPGESPVTNKLESYEFTIGSPGNYAVTAEDGRLTMNKASAAITITAASQKWTYDGDPHSNSTVTVTSGSLFRGDTLTATATGSVTNAVDTSEGNNPVAAGYKIMHGTEDVTDNYVITPVSGTLTINRKAVTVTANNAGKVYGTDDPAEFTAKVTGLVKDEPESLISYTVTRPGAGTDEAAGKYENAIVAAGDAVQGNYSVTYEPADFTISKAKLPKNPDSPQDPNASRFEVSKPENVIYNGSEQIQPVTVKDTVTKKDLTGEDIEITYSEDVTNAGTVTITIKARENGNYEGSFTRTYQIDRAPLTITADDKTKEYGERDPELTAVIDGIVDGDTVEYTLSREPGEDVGEYVININLPENETNEAGRRLFAASPKAASPANSNYDIKTEKGTFSITAAPVTITTGSASKVYDGTPLMGGNASITGLKNGERVTLRATGSRTAVGSSVNAYSIEWTTAKETNYTVTENLGILTVTAAPAPIPTPTPTPTPGGGGTVTPSPSIVPAPAVTDVEPEAVPNEQTSEPEEILEDNTPLAAAGAWALVNLLCAVVSALVSIVTLIMYFIGKKNDDDDPNDTQTAAEGGDDEKNEIKRKGLLRILSLIPGIGSVIVFFLTEDMSLPMVMTDKWTILMVILLAVTIVMAVLSKKKKKDADEEEEQTQA